ncbi:pyridoxamine 5'-phosphate oxidase family protein [Bordetella bronchiseptica]|uniref:pyridoxamine 5'-phosphate oxidase family protein n=1 Tax=Bordetella bronchiseptica TaxID=518 RepID=UPI004049EE6F
MAIVRYDIPGALMSDSLVFHTDLPGLADDPWHGGELAMQERAGARERMAQLGPRVIRDYMPQQHRDFFAQLPFMLLATVDAQGDPWASVLEGPPGFAHSPDERTLRLDAWPAGDDPARAGLAHGAGVGMLGIELSTRRRNRVNGHVAALDGQGFCVAVTQSFGNCPQYIQTRHARQAAPAPQPARWLAGLDAAARTLIGQADTLFVASYARQAGPHAVDVSHRGGPPGFVHLRGDTLTMPDFSGNRFFNTLGNLLANPRAGLVFVDFARGDLLQLCGRAEVLAEAGAPAAYPGAQRLWRVHVERAVRRPAALGLRAGFGEYAAQLAAVGQWAGEPPA